ncbi:MAG: glycosyltransferase family 4 protein [Methanomicrobiales archaeon]|nr:glycosyltransferase family 4 protein [Methanomicrobiales archaeon]
MKRKFELNNKFVILFVGRVAPAKGLNYLIKAINEIKHLPIVTLIVGPLRYMFGEKEEFSSYTRNLFRLVEKYDLQKKIIFTDAVLRKDLPKYYSCADVFVLPSIYEAIPMVCVEAMAAGKPVIGSKIGGIQEIIRDGENGFLFETKNYKDLAEKLINIMEDENQRKGMCIKSRKIAKNEFSWEVIGSKIFEVYKKCMK